MQLFPQKIESVMVPFDQFQLPAYFYPGGKNAERRPTLIMTIGGEAFAEDSYFWCGAAGMRRGYNVLAADLLPHVGTRFHNGKIPMEKMTVEWGIDRALESVVDYALSRSDVDPERLAIVGYSAGGTFAGRAVIRDRRLKALVADSPLYSLHELMAEEFLVALQKVPRLVGNAFVKAVTSRNEKAAIVLERSAWQVGADSVFGLMEAACDLTFDPADIPCPTLCLVGATESDVFQRQATHTYVVLDVPHKELHIFGVEEGAGAHCQLNNLTLMQQVMFDWLDTTFTGVGSNGTKGG